MCARAYRGITRPRVRARAGTLVTDAVSAVKGAPVAAAAAATAAVGAVGDAVGDAVGVAAGAVGVAAGAVGAVGEKILSEAEELLGMGDESEGEWEQGPMLDRGTSAPPPPHMHTPSETARGFRSQRPTRSDRHDASNC